MKARYSRAWKGSTQRRKQRKYVANAPLHTKGKFLSCHLVKDLRQKYGTRAVRLRSGDKVRVLRGNFRGREEKVDRIDVKKGKVFLTKIEVIKKDGATKVPFALNPSNLMIVELNTSDKKRTAKLKK